MEIQYIPLSHKIVIKNNGRPFQTSGPGVFTCMHRESVSFEVQSENLIFYTERMLSSSMMRSIVLLFHFSVIPLPCFITKINSFCSKSHWFRPNPLERVTNHWEFSLIRRSALGTQYRIFHTLRLRFGIISPFWAHLWLQRKQRNHNEPKIPPIDIVC